MARARAIHSSLMQLVNHLQAMSIMRPRNILVSRFRTRSRVRTAIAAAFAAGLALQLAACTVEPEPLSEASRSERIEGDLKVIRETRFVPDKPITLYEAMARAVTFNLEHRIREIETEIAAAELEQANYQLLPAFDTGAGGDYQNRATSTSSDRNARSANAGLAWNVLDLGVSYARAQQQANHVLIAAERRRKAYNDILRDVRMAFWRAASAGQLLRDAGVLSGQIQMAVRYSTELEASQVRDAKVSISYRRALLDSVRHMVAFRREISEAKAQLAELLNIPPGVDFALAEPAALYAVPSLPLSLPDMELTALRERAEIRTEDYQKRADDWHMKEQLYDLLPGIDLNLGANYSSDSFLLNNTWTASGIQLGMNLFNLFAIPGRLEAQEQGERLADARRMAMAIAVMAQVHISYRQHREALYQFALTRRIASADRRLTGLARQEAQLVNGGFLEVIEAGAREMRTALEEHRSYIDVVRTHNELMHAVGANEVPAQTESDTLRTVTAKLREQYIAWDQATGAADRLASAPLEALIEAALPSDVGVLVENEPSTGSSANSEPTEVAPSALAALGADFPAKPFGTPPLPPHRPDKSKTLPLLHFIAQVGAYRDSDRAAGVVQRLLSDRALRSFADLVHTDVLPSRKHGSLYVVRIGPFFARQEAKGLCEQIKQNQLDCIDLQQREMSLAMAIGRHSLPTQPDSGS